MKNIAIVTDSNSGITQSQAEELGIHVVPMPFCINGHTFYEDIDLTQEEFYSQLKDGSDISTSQPAVGTIMELWDELLKEYEEIVHIPMSSGLSGSCQSAMMLAREYGGKVHVVDNQRISVTQKQSVMEAKELAAEGKSGEEIHQILMNTKSDTSIYITLETLTYLKKGGRITPAAAALGTILRIKPVLQIQGEKLDAFAKARTRKQAKGIMLDAIKKDFAKRFGSDDTGVGMHIMLAYTGAREEAEDFINEVHEIFPEHQITADPLSLSVACHIGPGAIAIACTKKLI